MKRLPDGDTIIVNIQAIPFVGASKERFFLVLFEEQQSKKKGRREIQLARSSSRANNHLKRELEATREYLQSIIEEQEAMNEELRGAVLVSLDLEEFRKTRPGA